MTKLTFEALREANKLRIPLFRNSRGELSHSMRDGSDCSPSDWLQAVVGELGEYANFRKKFQRGDLTLEQFSEEAAKELADVQTYLDILALRCLDTPGRPHPTGVDLGQATIAKFDEVSDRVGCDVKLGRPRDKEDILRDVYRLIHEAGEMGFNLTVNLVPMRPYRMGYQLHQVDLHPSRRTYRETA